MVLINKTAMVRWNGRTRKYYESLGYSPFKNLEYFEVDVNHLLPRSEILVEVKCDYCGEIKNVTYKDYKMSKENTIIDKDCCNNCKILKTRESNLKLYGTEYPMQKDEIRKKQRNTVNEKYGVSHYSQTEEFKEKFKETSLEKFGTEHPTQNKDVIDKIKQTNISRYGVENVFQLEEVKEKSKETSLEKYGTEYYNQTEECRDRIKETFIEKYGVDHQSKVPEILEKIVDKNKLPFDEVKLEFDKRGYTLLEGTYVNSHTPMEYMCNKHNDITQFICLSNLKSGQCCSECQKEARREEMEERYRKMTEDKGYIFNYMEVKNGKTYINVTCKKHLELGGVTKLVSNFFRGVGCTQCGNENVGDLKRNDLQDVDNTFKERNYELLNLHEYKNNKTILYYICNEHPEEGIQETNYANVKRANTCKKCSYSLISGENHYLWKGGISPLHNYMRDKIASWKKDSLKHYDYKCVLTGIKSSNLVVHHFYNYSDILNETLLDLKLETKSSISEYTSEELLNIEHLLIKKHYEYGYGLPIISELHDLYHSLYGRTNNSLEEFNEFKERYNNGEFADRFKSII